MARGLKAVAALDHDIRPDCLLVPLGILEFSRGENRIDQPWITFGHSLETADFVADALQQWWNERSSDHPRVGKLQIELDNGPEINSSRTQFMKRLVDFSDQNGLEIELVYLPPCHSKYNPIERFWGILEQHWNEALLSSVRVALNWACTATWRGICPIIREIKTVYQRGVKLTKKAFRPIAERLQRSKELPKWSLTIKPKTLVQ